MSHPRTSTPPSTTSPTAPSSKGAIRRFNLDTDSTLVLDRIVAVREASASADSGDHPDATTTETMVQYRQVIDGVPVITPGAGVVRVFVDNDGTVTSVQSTSRTVDQLTDRAQATTGNPPVNGAARQSGPQVGNADSVLAAALTDRLRQLTIRGSSPTGYSIVPGSTEVGYDVQGGTAALVAQQAVELEFGPRYRKRYWLKGNLFQ